MSIKSLPSIRFLVKLYDIKNYLQEFSIRNRKKDRECFVGNLYLKPKDYGINGRRPKGSFQLFRFLLASRFPTTFSCFLFSGFSFEKLLKLKGL